MKGKCILCGNENNARITLFGFPKDGRKQEWLSFCNVDSVSSYNKLCILHFKAEYISKCNDRTGRISLKRNAVPTENRRVAIVEPPKSKLRKHANCYVCGNNSGTSTYFSFKKEWASLFQIEPNLDPDQIHNSAKLCDKHFRVEDIVCNPQGKILRLKDGVVPSKLLRVELDIDMEVIPSDSWSKNTGTTYDTNLSEDSIQTHTLLPIQGPNMQTDTIHITPTITSLLRVELDIDMEVIPSDSRSKNTGTTYDTNLSEDSIQSHTLLPIQGPNMQTDTIHITPTITSQSASRRLHFVGDIRTPDLSTPRRAKKCFDIVRKNIIKKTKIIESLRQKQRRLKKRITTIKKLVEHLKDKDMLTEQAKDALIVRINTIVCHIES